MSTIDNKYLVLRGKNKDIYFIQKRVSKAVSKVIGKDFIKKSLDTTDINVAREKRDKILQELDNIANKHAQIDEFDDNMHDQTNFNDVNQTILSKKENINEQALKYINRLSDLFFVLSRVENDNGKKDILWKPGKNV